MKGATFARFVGVILLTLTLATESFAFRIPPGLNSVTWNLYPPLPSRLEDYAAVSICAGWPALVSHDGRLTATLQTPELQQIADGLTDVVDVEGSQLGLIALRRDGTVAIVGYFTNQFDSELFVNLPYVPTDVREISTLQNFVLMRTGEGRVYGAGIQSPSGECVPPASLRDCVSVKAGTSFSVALRANGSMVGWGGDLGGRGFYPLAGTNVVEIAATSYASYARLRNGQVLLFDAFSPGIPVPGISNAISLHGGWAHALALQGDGRVTELGRLEPPPAWLKGAQAIYASEVMSVAFIPQPVIRDTNDLAFHGTHHLHPGDRLEWTATYPRNPSASFQWMKNGAPIPGATGASLVFESLANDDSGTYTVIADGSMESPATELHVGIPLITLNPLNLVAQEGAPFTLHVEAQAADPIRYAWRIDGVPFMEWNAEHHAFPEGFTPSGGDFSPTNTARTMAGSYDVVVSTDWGSVTSSVAVVTVRPSPTVDQQSTGDFIRWVPLQDADVRWLVAQSFTPAFEGRLSRIELSGSPPAVPPPYQCWVEIVEMNNGQPGTTVLGRGLVDFEWASTSVSFEPQQIHLKPGLSYAMVISAVDTPQLNLGYYGFRSLPPSAYPTGTVLRRLISESAWTPDPVEVLWFQTFMWPETSPLWIEGLPTDLRVDAGQTRSLELHPLSGAGVIASIELLANGTSLGSVKSAPYTWQWTPSTAGPVTLEAILTPVSGAETSLTLARVEVLSGRPPGDDFSQSTPLSGVSATSVFSLNGATSEPSESPSNPSGLGRTVWWSWNAPRDGEAVIRATGPGGRFAVAAWSGGSLATLLMNAAGEGECRFNASSNTVYSFSVDALDAASHTGSLQLAQNNVDLTSPVGGAVYGFPATIPIRAAQRPAGRTLTSVRLLTNGVLAKQWTTPPSNDSLPLPSSGSYELRLESTDVNGLVTTSSPATINVRPKNDAYASAITLTGASALVTTSNQGAGAEDGDPHYGDNQGGHSIWYRWKAPSDGICVLRPQTSSFDLMLGAYTGTKLSSLVEVAANAFALGGSSVSFMATAGTTYSIMVDGLWGDQGPLAWSLEIAPANDFVAYRRPVLAMPFDEIVSLDGASLEEGESYLAPGGAAGSLWWWWRADQSARLRIRAAASSTRVALGVFNGNRMVWFSPLASSGPMSGTAELDLPVAVGERIEIVLFGEQPVAGDVRLTMQLDSLRIISPVAGGILRSGSEILLDARLDAPSTEVTTVAYRANGVLVAESSPGTTRAGWHPAKPGGYRLTAETTTAGGTRWLSLPVNIRVQDDASIPLPKLIATSSSPIWFARDAIGSFSVMGAERDWFDLDYIPDASAPTPIGKSPSGSDWVDFAGTGYTLTYFPAPQTQIWALDADGHLYLNGREEIAPPAGAQRWTKVFGGIDEPAAMTDTGRAYALHLGRGPEVIAGDEWETVSAAPQGGYGLTRSGRVTGLAWNVELTWPAGVHRWLGMRAGYPGVYLLGDDGNIYTGVVFALEGTIKLPGKPISRPAGVTRWLDFASGQQHVAALGDDGQLYVMGSNASGQLGVGPSIASTLNFTKVPTPPGVTRWITFSAGQYQTMALGDDCSLYVWGLNSLKALGVLSAGPVYVPTRMPMLGGLCGEPVVFLEGPGSLQPGGGLKLEFPTLLNRRYLIQYTDDLATWKNVDPLLLGTGAVVTWIDKGPPATDSLPAGQALRLYRVVFAP